MTAEGLLYSEGKNITVLWLSGLGSGLQTHVDRFDPGKHLAKSIANRVHFKRSTYGLVALNERLKQCQSIWLVLTEGVRLDTRSTNYPLVYTQTTVRC